MLEQLQRFFFRFGHCYVPVRDAEYQDLYAWCQRLRESRSRLSEELITELVALRQDLPAVPMSFSSKMGKGKVPSKLLSISHLQILAFRPNYFQHLTY